MDWVIGTRPGWFLAGIFIVAFVAVAYFVITKIKAARDKKKGPLV